MEPLEPFYRAPTPGRINPLGTRDRAPGKPDTIGIFHYLLESFTAMRRGGSTTLLMTEAHTGGMIIVSPTDKDAELINRDLQRMKVASGLHGPGEAMGLNRFFAFAMRGRRPTPVVLDNYTVMYLCERALDQFGALKDYASKLMAEVAALVAESKVVDGKVQLLNRACDALVTDNKAKNIQIDALKADLLKAKAKLAVRQVSTVRVIRRRGR